MAKGNFLLHGSRGKIGNIVTAKLKGQTIIREYNDAPANPKSPAQMEQRIKFATVGKFFSRAQQNLVKFAFENKAQNQSDYNAFVSENLKAGNFVYLTPDALNDPFMPIVAPWILTKGSITRDYDYRDGVLDANVISAVDGVDIVALPFNVGDADGDALTNWNDFMAANPSMQIGDIVTLVVINTDAQWDGATVYPGSYQPIYCIRQFEIGADLQGANVMDYLAACGFESHDAGDFNFGSSEPDLALALNVTTASGKEFQFGTAETGACTACALIISRNTPNGVKVSNSSLVLSEAAANANSYLNSDEVKEAALTAWGASEDAILQGSLSTPKSGWLPSVTAVAFDTQSKTLGGSTSLEQNETGSIECSGTNLKFSLLKVVQSSDHLSLTDIVKTPTKVTCNYGVAEDAPVGYSADIYVNNVLVQKIQVISA